MINRILQDLPIYLMRIPVILLALTVHESAHGWAAYKMGDPTAKNMGRLTLNPLKHLDPFGSITLLLFGFGWARPVPINARYFKNPKKGMAISALAGPASNLILGFIGIFLFELASKFLAQSFHMGNTMAYVIILFLMVFYTLNISLAVFNLIPIPPLDGSRILFVMLPQKYYFGLMKYERYIYLVMLLLLFTGILSVPLSAAVSGIIRFMTWLVRLLPFI